MGLLGPLRLMWHGDHLWIFYCYRVHICFDQGPKITLGGPDHSDNTDKRKESWNFHPVRENWHFIKNQKKMLYFIHLPVALSNKYTTHALDKLKKNLKIGYRPTNWTTLSWFCYHSNSLVSRSLSSFINNLRFLP